MDVLKAKTTIRAKVNIRITRDGYYSVYSFITSKALNLLTEQSTSQKLQIWKYLRKDLAMLLQVDWRSAQNDYPTRSRDILC